MGYLAYRFSDCSECRTLTMKYVWIRFIIYLAILILVFSCLYIPTNDYIVWIEDGVIKSSENGRVEEIKKVYQLGDLIIEEEIEEIINRYATGTKAYQMKRTIYCECQNRNIQSNIVKNGIRENSWGLSQIHIPSHPQVSIEQALDPEFAIKFMSDNWGKVKWYGYITEKDACNTIYN